jgi:DNA-binding GntR family transcriptional regulator
MREAQGWGLTLAAGARAPLFEATIINLRLRSAPHLAASLYADAPDDPAFFQFTVHIQDEFVLAVRARDADRAHDLRRADLQTFQRYLYRRLGWSE